MSHLKKTILPILLTGIWLNVAITIGWLFILEGYWIEKYNSLNLVFPTGLINNITWMIWGFMLATIVFILSKKFNTVLERSEQDITAVNLERNIARLLTLPENAAGLFMESVTYNDNHIPIEILYSYYRGDKYRFEIELGRYRLEENGTNHFSAII